MIINAIDDFSSAERRVFGPGDRGKRYSHGEARRNVEYRRRVKVDYQLTDADVPDTLFWMPQQFQVPKSVREKPMTSLRTRR